MKTKLLACLFLFSSAVLAEEGLIEQPLGAVGSGDYIEITGLDNKVSTLQKPTSETQEYRLMAGCTLKVDEIYTSTTDFRAFRDADSQVSVTIEFTAATDIALTTLSASSFWVGRDSEPSKAKTTVNITLDDKAVAAVLKALAQPASGGVFSQNILIATTDAKVNICDDTDGCFNLHGAIEGWVFDPGVTSSVDKVAEGHIALVGLQEDRGSYMSSPTLALVARGKTTPVPEPAAPLLVLLSMLPAAIRRRRFS